MLTAKDIMTRAVVTASLQSTVREAISTALQHEISGLPVMDTQGDIVGIITQHGMLAAVCDPSILCDPVVEHMTSTVVSVDEDTPLPLVAREMIRFRIRQIPVTQGNRLVGVVERADLLRTLCAI